MLTETYPSGKTVSWTYKWADKNTFVITKDGDQILKAEFSE